MTRAFAVLLAGLVALAAPARADELPYGRTVTSVEVVGPAGTARLVGQLPVRKGQPLQQTAIQQGIRNLHRLGVFEQVRAIAEEDGEGVRVRFELSPARRIAHMTFVGATVLDETRLRRASELQTGVEFTPERAARAAALIAQAYFAAGHREAEVRWDAIPSGEKDVALDFSIAEGDPTTLVRLEFPGRPALAPGELLAAFDLQPGDVLSLAEIDEGLERLKERYRLRGFHAATLGRPVVHAADGRAVVEIPLDAGPLYRLQVRGHRTFDSALLLAVLGYDGIRPLDEATKSDLSARLRAFYEHAGFPDVTVVVRESGVPAGRSPKPPGTQPEPLGWSSQFNPARLVETGSDGERVITFIVREGDPIRVVERRFEGVKAYSETELGARIDVVLRDAMPMVLGAQRDAALLRASWATGDPATNERRRAHVEPTEVFARGVWRAACAQLTDLYKADGYLDAQVGPARLERTGKGLARVVVPVHEGVQTLVDGFDIVGVAQLPYSRVAESVRLEKETPLSFFAVEEARNAILALYQREGFLYAQVDETEDIDQTGTRARIVFKVEEGAPVRISRVELRGLGRTDPAFVRETVKLREGDVVTPQALQEATNALLGLGLFTSGAVDVADPELVASDKALVVDVREKPARTLELRAGGSLADGPRASMAGSMNNLFGRAAALTGSLKLNWPFPRICAESPEDCNSSALPTVPWERRANLNLTIPRHAVPGVLPADLRVDAVHERLLRPAFELARYAGVLSLDGLGRRRLGPGEISSLLQLEIERDEFGRRLGTLTQVVQTLADQRAQLLPEGDIVLVSLRPTLTWDGRDDRLNPTKGMLASVSLDYSRSLSAQTPAPESRPFEISLLRTLVSASGWIPLYRPGRVVLALGGRVGLIAKAEDSVVIGTKRFFLGGTQTLRGANEDGVVPEDVRATLRDALDRCRSLVSGLACSEEARKIAAGSQPQSEGGELLISARAELRFAASSSTDIALFGDGGNIWLDNPGFSELASVGSYRYATGVGLRFATPVGPAAVDFGVNLTRDVALNEPLWRPHLSVGVY